MGNPVIEAIEERAEQIAATAEASESLQRLDDAAVAALRHSGVVKMLAPEKYDGGQAHPADFAEAVMATARIDGSAGWVAGIVGVHPWEMALADSRVQEEVWGESTDTWIASPYAPMGVLRPVDDGYLLSGRWQFSSGTDHCQWIFLGAMVAGADGVADPTLGSRHAILPRADYEIVADSWNVVGLKGTGSKDIIVRDAFIPSYRTMEYDRLIDGSAPRDAGASDPTYLMPFTTVFPAGITSAVIGICEGALAHHLAYQSGRMQVTGVLVKDDPYVLSAIGAAAEEIHASRVTFLDSLRRTYDAVAEGKTISLSDRIANRRAQVAAAWRAVQAMDQVVARSGGNGMRMDSPIQRFWRDGHMGLAHAIHVCGPVFHASGLDEIGASIPAGPLLSMI